MCRVLSAVPQHTRYISTHDIGYAIPQQTTCPPGYIGYCLRRIGYLLVYHLCVFAKTRPSPRKTKRKGTKALAGSLTATGVPNARAVCYISLLRRALALLCTRCLNQALPAGGCDHAFETSTHGIIYRQTTRGKLYIIAHRLLLYLLVAALRHNIGDHARVAEHPGAVDDPTVRRRRRVGVTS